MFDADSTVIETGEDFRQMWKIEAIVIISFNCQESPIHRALFWVAISVLQLDEISLYAAGLALLEQNLHTLNSQGTFEKTVCAY